MGRGREKALFTLWIVCGLPGILSAICSTRRKNSTSSDASSGLYNLFNPDVQNSFKEINCLHGACTEDGLCECNPCWSGPTCEEYVDRFAPQFLAEEPFFIHDDIVDNAEPRPCSLSSSNSYSCWHSAAAAANSHDKLPLFRIESSDDDLGLTCLLGQVGPAATCPCATPRYSVVGSSKYMFYTDEETGDVFLRDGLTLQPSRHYFIRLQVKALQVNSSFYKPWTSQVMATLYVRPSRNASASFDKLETDLHLYIETHAYPGDGSMRRNVWRRTSGHGHIISASASKSINTIFHDGQDTDTDINEDDSSSSSSSSEESDEVNSHSRRSSSNPPYAIPVRVASMRAGTAAESIFRIKRQQGGESASSRKSSPIASLS